MGVCSAVGDQFTNVGRRGIDWMLDLEISTASRTSLLKYVGDLRRITRSTLHESY